MLRSLVSILVVSLAACGPQVRAADGGSEVSLEVSADAVAPGDSVTLTLRNRSSGSIGYNLCSSALEERRGAGWEPVPSDRVCTMELRTLAPGQSADFTIEIPADLPRGEYRYVTTMERLEPGERVTVPSEPFTVDR